MTTAQPVKKPEAVQIIPDFARVTLVPIANPNTAPDLLRLALSLADPGGGRVIALIVSTGTLENEAGALGQLKSIVDEFAADGRSIELESVSGTSIARGILDTAREIGADLIVLGIKQPAYGEVTLGTVVESVITTAPCDVLVCRMPGTKNENGFERIIVPVDGSVQSRVAARTAIRLGKSYDVMVEAVHVQGGHHSHHEGRARIEQMLEGLPQQEAVKRTVVTAQSPSGGILARVKADDLIVVGFSERSELERWMFGDITRDLLNNAPGPVIMVARAIGGDLFSVRLRRRVMGWIRPVLTRVEQEEIVRQARDMATLNIDFTALILISATLATLGLLLNSAAVIIGAMLVAPLMSPLIGISVGLTVGHSQTARRGAVTIITGVALALGVASLIGLVLPYLSITPEMAARGSPTLLDAGVALASGIVGAYATARKDIPAALAGVAIAAALMPPLCTVGLGLALQNPDLAFGAGVLFLTNIISIILAGSVVFAWLGMNPRQADGTTLQRQVFSLVMVLLIALPVTYELIILTQRANKQAEIERQLESALLPAEVVSFDTAGSTPLRITATVRTASPISARRVRELQEQLGAALNREVTLELVLWQVIRPGTDSDLEADTSPETEQSP